LKINLENCAFRWFVLCNWINWRLNLSCLNSALKSIILHFKFLYFKLMIPWIISLY